MNPVKVSFSSFFKKALKYLLKKNPGKRKIFEEKSDLFLKDPYHSQLETHKLRGKLKGYLSFTVEYDLRVIFYFAGNTEIVFVDIGAHDEVY